MGKSIWSSTEKFALKWSSKSITSSYLHRTTSAGVLAVIYFNFSVC